MAHMVSAQADAHGRPSGGNAKPAMRSRTHAIRSSELEKIMLSDFEVLRAADQMMNEFGDHAELQAAKYADLMLGHSNRAGLLVWARIWRTIAEKRPAQTGLAH
jgi:hypothetical protein